MPSSDFKSLHCLQGRARPWRGKVCVQQRYYTTPYFATPDEAARVVDRYLYKLGKETNFPVSEDLAAELDALTIEQIEEQFREQGEQARKEAQAARPFSRGVSKYRGVSLHKVHEKWQVGIRPTSQSRLNLGTFPTQEEAASSYDAASFILHGKSGKFNFPERYLTISDEAGLELAISVLGSDKVSKLRTLQAQGKGAGSKGKKARASSAPQPVAVSTTVPHNLPTAAGGQPQHTVQACSLPEDGALCTQSEVASSENEKEEEAPPHDTMEEDSDSDSDPMECDWDHLQLSSGDGDDSGTDGSDSVWEEYQHGEEWTHAGRADIDIEGISDGQVLCKRLQAGVPSNLPSDFYSWMSSVEEGTELLGAHCFQDTEYHTLHSAAGGTLVSKLVSILGQNQLGGALSSGQIAKALSESKVQAPTGGRTIQDVPVPPLGSQAAGTKSVTDQDLDLLVDASINNEELGGVWTEIWTRALTLPPTLSPAERAASAAATVLTGRIPELPGWSGAWECACHHADKRAAEECDEDEEMNPRSGKYDPLHRETFLHAYAGLWMQQAGKLFQRLSTSAVELARQQSAAVDDVTKRVTEALRKGYESACEKEVQSLLAGTWDSDTNMGPSVTQVQLSTEELTSLLSEVERARAEGNTIVMEV